MKLFYIIFFVCLPRIVFCQDKISGKVMSEKGDVLPRANVFISNTTIGAYTDASGEFILNKVPGGNIEVAVSYVGYETVSVIIPADAHRKRYIIKLRPQSNELATVIVGKYDKRGWKKWGYAFTEAFIGTSSYAKNCVITNTDIIRFLYNDKTKQLHAYAGEPLLIENKSLGYHIAVTLVDFVYSLSDKNVDYQVYSFFSEMQGTEDQELEWKKNREDAYSFSFMHFMRALYVSNFKNEGFQVRIIERNLNEEKQRVQVLYKNSFIKIKDSLGSKELNGNAVNKLIENSFTRDSVAYYHRVLEQNDKTENLHLELAGFKDIASQTANNTVLFNFKDYLQVTYIKAKEPKEYAVYKNKLYAGMNFTDFDNQRIYPNTELSLIQNIPIEINENGYFNNVDLFMQGFWGWWEKMATKLPYGYEP